MSFKASYNSRMSIIQQNADIFNDDCDAFDISPDEADSERADSTVWDLVAPSIAQDDAMTKNWGLPCCRITSPAHNLVAKAQQVVLISLQIHSLGSITRQLTGKAWF